MTGLKRPSRKALAATGIGLTTVLMAAGTAFTLAPGGATASAGAPSARYLASARAALVKYLQHDQAPASHAPLPGSGGGFNALRPSNATSGSYNWSGYADTSTTTGYYKSVSGSWTTPSVTASCTAEDTLAAQWVGLDGWMDSTVEQDGVIDWCFEGHATYYTWYEMYPAGSVTVGKTLQPGDQIVASVSHAGSTYRLILTDATHTGNNVAKAAACAAATCKDLSAEWISERPDFSTSGYAPLADFGAWSLDGASVKGGTVSGTSINSYKDSELGMIDSTGSYALATPSSLTAGRSFTVTWDNSY
jgi:hypothetical protein